MEGWLRFMRAVTAVASIILLLSAGCGRGSRTVVDDPFEDSLDGMRQCLAEALESARVLTTPPSATNEDPDADPPNVAPLPAAVGVVVAAAQAVVKAAASRPVEPQAKAMLAAAQDLETKAKSGAPPATIEQGLQQLRNMLTELRKKP